MARPKAKVIWNSPVAAPAALGNQRISKGTGNVLDRDLWPLPSPQNFFSAKRTDDYIVEYTSFLVTGGLFVTTVDCWLLNNVWDRTQGADEQIPYIYKTRLNPNGLGSSTKLPKGTMAIYLEQKRVPEWAGKEWRRYVRPAFFINGQVVLALSSTDLHPVDMVQLK
jgi:hypothetical protein